MLTGMILPCCVVEPYKIMDFKKKNIFEHNHILPWFLFSVTFGVLLQLLFLDAPLQSDDTTYFAIAKSLSLETFRNAYNQTHLRTGILVPAYLIIKSFGYNIFSYYIFSVGFSTLLLISIFILTNRLIGVLPAVLSSLLFSCSTFGLYQTTNLLPDVPNLFFLFAAFYFFSISLEKTGKKCILILVLAVCCGFYAYLIRMPNTIFLICIPVYEYLHKKSIRKSILFALFFLGFWIIESTFYLIVAKDFLLRLNMVPKGVTSWKIYQPSISLNEYLYQPFTNLLRFNSGLILLPCGFLGALTAIKNKNHAMISILIGSFILFLSYSYSVNSFSPLVRALPLQLRYVICFTTVLTILTGYLLSVTYEKLAEIININNAKILMASFLIGILCFELKNYSTELPYRILYSRDSYFVADRLLGDYLKNNRINEVVYTIPFKDFKLYPNFSKLKLKPCSLSKTPQKESYFLISKSRIKKSLYYSRLRKDENVTKNGLLLSQDYNPKWKYIINTDEIVLAYIPSFDIKYEEIVDLLSEKHKESIWVWNDNYTKRTKDCNGLGFVSNHAKAQYIYTFPGGFDATPKDFEKIFKALSPNETYMIQMTYEIKDPINSLIIFWSEYDHKQRIKSLSENLPSSVGKHEYKRTVTLSKDYEAFRIFLRLKAINQKTNSSFCVEGMTISKIR